LETIDFSVARMNLNNATNYVLNYILREIKASTTIIYDMLIIKMIYSHDVNNWSIQSSQNEFYKWFCLPSFSKKNNSDFGWCMPKVTW